MGEHLNNPAAQAAKEKAKPLSYDELKEKLTELYEQYQKAVQTIQHLQGQLNNFDFMSFFLTMAFKVMEHPEMYNQAFVTACSERIEGMIGDLMTATEPQPENTEDGSK